MPLPSQHQCAVTQIEWVDLYKYIDDVIGMFREDTCNAGGNAYVGWFPF